MRRIIALLAISCAYSEAYERLDLCFAETSMSRSECINEYGIDSYALGDYRDGERAWPSEPDGTPSRVVTTPEERAAYEASQRGNRPTYRSAPTYDSGPNCVKGCRCGNACIACSKRCHK